MAKDLVKTVLTMLIVGFFVLIIAKMVWIGAPNYIDIQGFQPNLLLKYVVAAIFIYAGYFVWNRFVAQGSMSLRDFYALAIAAGVLLFIYLKVLPGLGIIDSGAALLQSILGG